MSDNNKPPPLNIPSLPVPDLKREELIKKCQHHWQEWVKAASELYDLNMQEFQNQANQGNPSEFPMMGNMGGMGNMGNMGSMGNIGNMGGMGSMGSMPNMPNMGNMTNMPNMYGSSYSPQWPMQQGNNEKGWKQ